MMTSVLLLMFPPTKGFSLPKRGLSDWAQLRQLSGTGYMLFGVAGCLSFCGWLSEDREWIGSHMLATLMCMELWTERQLMIHADGIG